MRSNLRSLWPGSLLPLGDAVTVNLSPRCTWRDEAVGWGCYAPQREQAPSPRVRISYEIFSRPGPHQRRPTRVLTSTHTASTRMLPLTIICQ